MAVGLNVEIDLGDVPAKFDLILLRIETLRTAEMPNELVEWQSDDMRRQWPNIELGIGPESTDTWAATRIWPRSRLSPQIKPGGRRRTYRSTRPILRTELFGMLVARMQALLFNNISWR